MLGSDVMTENAIWYMSRELFKLAQKARLRSQTDSSEAVTAIVLSALALEAFFNDFVHFVSWFSDGREEELFGTFAITMRECEDSRIQLTTKVRVAYNLLTGSEIQKGAKPYQDFKLLVDIRNALVHKRPEKSRIEIQEDCVEYTSDSAIVSKLANNRVFLSPGPERPSSLVHCLQAPSAADWAIDTVETIADLLAAALPESATKEAVDHMLLMYFRMATNKGA